MGSTFAENRMKQIRLDCHKKYAHATMIGTEASEIKTKRLAHTAAEFKEFIGDKATVAHDC